MIANRPSQLYLDTLLQYYEEEVQGEAYFNCIADRLPNPDHQAKMQLMAKVENFAAAAVLPLVRKYELKPKPAADLHAAGDLQAAREPTDWSTLIGGMIKTFPAYINDFEWLEAIAPKEDLPELKILTAHEVAAIAFLNREANGDPDSTGLMRHYLETGTV